MSSVYTELMKSSAFLCLFTFLILLAGGNTTAHAQSIGSFYDSVDAFLGPVVDNGLVDYAAIKADPAELQALVNTISTLDRTSLSEMEEQAFLINAYNMLVIKNVVDHYPLDSPLDANGFFDRDKFQVSGESFTLNDLEKKDLFKKYPDARFHFVLVCAAIGCPVLIPEAYRAESLERQLVTQTRVALNSPRHVRTTGGKLLVSELFSWYEADFTSRSFKSGAASVAAYINQFRDDKVDTDARLDYITYDWQLNDQKKKP